MLNDKHESERAAVQPAAAKANVYYIL